MDAKSKSVLQMVICSVLWSIAGIFIKLIPWNAFAVAGCRSLISLLTVGTFLIITKTKVRFTKKTFLSGIMMALTFLAFVCANKLTTAANAIVLQFTAPVFILIYSAIFFKHKPLKSDIIVVVCTLFGISLFFFDQLSPGRMLGNIVGILSGMFMAGMYVAIGSAQEDERMGSMVIGHLTTAICGIPFLFFTDSPITAVPVICIFVLGVVQLGIPYILFMYANRHCPPLACALLGAIEPLLNPVWVLIFDGEAPGIFSLIGGIFVIATITIWCVWDKKHEAQNA